MAKVPIMNVRAAAGTRCPMEGRPRVYITDAEPMAVPESAYYLRRVQDGSLVKAEAPSATPQQGGRTGTGTEAAPEVVSKSAPASIAQKSPQATSAPAAVGPAQKGMGE